MFSWNFYGLINCGYFRFYFCRPSSLFVIQALDLKTEMGGIYTVEVWKPGWVINGKLLLITYVIEIHLNLKLWVHIIQDQ